MQKVILKSKMEIEKVDQNSALKIPTLNGKFIESSFTSGRYCLGAESFLHNNGDQAQGELALSLQNLHKILKNPKISRANMVLNEPHKIASALNPLLSASSPDTPLFFVDCTRIDKSRDLQKLKQMELGDKIKVGYCYLPQYSYVNNSTSLDEIKLVLEEKRVFKKIEHECFDGPLCFTALGVLNITSLMEKDHFENLMWPGLARFSAVHDAPILIDLDFRDSEIKVKQWIDANIEKRIRSHVVFLNLKTYTEETHTAQEDNFEITELKKCVRFDNYVDLVTKGFFVQFGIFRFLRLGFSEKSVAKILEIIVKKSEEKEPGSSNRIMVTTGIDYKTDFQEYGGPGIEVFNQVFNCLDLPINAKNRLFRENCLKLYTWWRPKKVSKEDVRLTKCYICGSEGRDVSKWFSKDGLFFKTPACFKKYLKSQRNK